MAFFFYTKKDNETYSKLVSDPKYVTTRQPGSLSLYRDLLYIYAFPCYLTSISCNGVECSYPSGSGGTGGGGKVESTSVSAMSTLAVRVLVPSETSRSILNDVSNIH